ncbi:LptF/LptG family permease [Candidatus Pelagibacter sp.]|nr:LptF/LptG family permease [Candidatus Pelagibacter sp.]
MVKTLDRYFISLFFKKLLILSVIFFSLSFTLTIFEEITFLSKSTSAFYLPFVLAIFDAPTTLLEIFPFVILIAAQLFFIELIKKKENELIKINNLNNFYLIKLLAICSFLFGIIIITIYYPVSSKLKFIYSDIKNVYSEDGKYLKHLNDNGIWIKDEIENEIYIINGAEKKDPFLKDVFISKFDNNFELIENIFTNQIDITSYEWVINNPIIFKNNRQIQLEENIILKTHFNIKKINSSFRNLNSFNLIQLIDIKKENTLLGYSSQDIDLHFLKIISLPIYFTILVIISSIIMLNIKKNKPYIFHVLLGISLSVIIYYINNIFNVFGLTNKIPIYLSVFFPMIFLSIISIIGLLRINEK